MYINEIKLGKNSQLCPKQVTGVIVRIVKYILTLMSYI